MDEAAEARAKSLERLYDYTKFHIGVYLTLTAAFITLATATGDKGNRLVPLDMDFVWPAIVAFLVAGAAGGIIATSLTEQVGGSSDDFLKRDIGPSNFKTLHRLKGRTYTQIEHGAFWVGIACAVLSFVK